MFPNGIVFLPLRHTELLTGPTRAVRRHFLEMGAWVPTDGFSTWQLTWRVYEVVRENFVPVANETPFSVRDRRPPQAFNLDAVTELRVTDSGDVEWATPRSVPPRRAIVPPPGGR